MHDIRKKNQPIQYKLIYNQHSHQFKSFFIYEKYEKKIDCLIMFEQMDKNVIII